MSPKAVYICFLCVCMFAIDKRHGLLKETIIMVQYHASFYIFIVYFGTHLTLRE